VLNASSSLTTTTAPKAQTEGPSIELSTYHQSNPAAKNAHGTFSLSLIIKSPHKKTAV
jgi:hypothetical protein